MRSSSRTLGHAVLVLAGYSLVFCWVFGQPLSSGEYPAELDLYDWFLPIFLSKFALWSHEMFAGVPLFADTSDSQYYVVHFLFSHVLHWWTGYIIAAYVLAASFMYAYVFTVTRSRLAAVFAGTAYALSAPLIQRMAHINIAHASAWFPLLVLSVDRLLDGSSNRWIAIGAVAEASIFLSGHPQPILYAVSFALVYALVGALALGVSRDVSLKAGLLFGLGVLLTCVKALPFLQTSLYMARQEISYEWFITPIQSPLNMLGALFPKARDTGLGVPLYVGVGVLCLAVLGVAMRREGWRAWVWGTAALIAFLVVAGSATPVAWLVYHIPGYNNFRISSRMLFVYSAATAALAGFAIAAVQRRQVDVRAIAWTMGPALGLLVASAIVVARVNGLTLAGGGHSILTHVTFATQLAVAASTALAVFVARRTRYVPAAILFATAVTAADLVYNGPYAATLRGLTLTVIDARNAAPSVHALKIAALIAPTHQRMLSVAGAERDPVIPGGLARYWGIETAGGFSPIMANRLATMARMGAAGDVYPDVLKFDDRSLDLLAVRYIVVGDNEYPAPETFDREGLTWARPSLGFTTGRSDCTAPLAKSFSLRMPPAVNVSSIALVTHLRCATDVEQGTEVGVLEVTAVDGTTLRRPLLAGVDIGDKDLSDDETRDGAHHRSPSNVFDDPDLRPYAYLVRVDLPKPVSGGALVLRTVPIRGWATFEHLTLVDDTGRSWPQDTGPLLLSNGDRWREVSRFRTSRETDRGADQDVPGEHEFTVYENLRTLPSPDNSRMST
jgi:hypothetical protein